jgi:TrmH family RNA methyltransferase
MSEGTKRLVQHVRAVREGKVSELIFIEGVRLCEEAADLIQIDTVVFSPKLLRNERGTELLNKFEARQVNCVELSDDKLESLGDTKTPQGIILLAERPASGPEVLRSTGSRTPLIVILHQMNNPANAGAMVRVAEAAGATGIIATSGTTDMFSPKALRGSMGSSFRVPIWMGASFDEAIAWCRAQKIQTVSTDLVAAQTHTQLDWRESLAVVVGSESDGLSELESQATDIRIRIPMHEPVESLNAAVALAVVLYEAARQRSSL